MTLRLGVNIDHVATLRNARGGAHPSVVEAAKIVERAGGNGITMHLREDRRHIRDADVFAVKEVVNVPINFEMAATNEMVKVALKLKPHACCIVPEKREELTTEGGLDVVGQLDRLKPICHMLKEEGIRVSLFIDPSIRQTEAAERCHADIVELHTGEYCEASGETRQHELEKLEAAAKQAHQLGLEVHGGHGLTYKTVGSVAAIPEMVELNIGHFLVGQAVFDGLEVSIKKMRASMDEAQA